MVATSSPSENTGHILPDVEGSSAEGAISVGGDEMTTELKTTVNWAMGR